MVQKLIIAVSFLLCLFCSHLPGIAGPPGAPPGAAVNTHESTYGHTTGTPLDTDDIGVTVETFPESAFTTKIGAAYDTSAELSALFATANQRGTEGETLQSLTDQDATPAITDGSGSIYRTVQSANTAPTTITDFVDDDGDHSDFSEGDEFFDRIDDANTTIDFTTDGNLRRMGNSGLNYTGIATISTYLHFRYTGTVWICTNLAPGVDSPTHYTFGTVDLPHYDKMWVIEGTVATGDGKMLIPFGEQLDGYNLTYVLGTVGTAATGSGSETTDITIYNLTDSQDVLSTALTIDEDELSSLTAAAAHVINTTYDDVDEGDLWEINVDAVPSTTPGDDLLMILGFEKP